MSTIKEELAATAKWLANPETMKRIKSGKCNSLFAFTHKDTMTVAGMVSSEHMPDITCHIIDMLLEQLEEDQKREYLTFLMLHLIKLGLDNDMSLEAEVEDE